jgi:succinate dehydrogenase / fumarate reductase membrane anchor subunit
VVKRIVVGAHYGLRGWLVQRISAIVMTLYTAAFVAAFAAAKPVEYVQWKALFSQGWMRFATLAFFVSVLLHAWVGMRDILMDDIKPTGWRLALQSAVILVLVGAAGWAAQILWRT